ncbi:hypothetical protein ACJ73_08383 [Blastomyces percursus]|uniref:DUF7924 domain-containing protein n=1 Tax=Blastomyces percursus TaxID=1658174 RepID=A0A1J9QWQ6_9EURO|nr:hypothetical protein ACJ73_08383 [Blastomyces percursus]
MPSLETLHHPCKRKHLEHPSETLHHQPKRQKSGHPQAYWDNLSTVHLTRSAIKEFDRRNDSLDPQRPLHRPVTRQLHVGQEVYHYCPEKPILLPGFLRGGSSSHLKGIKRFSRLGGPDLSDLRNYPIPMSSRTPSSHCRKRRAESPPSSASRDTKTTTKTSSTSAFSWNFQQNLIDHGVYPHGYEYPDGRKPDKPGNWKEINERLAQLRSSLSPSRFSEEAFDAFARADAHASKEQPVISSVIPIIDGDIGDRKCVGGNYLFGNLAPLTDGTLASAKPDHFYGARPEQLTRQIRDELRHHIVPSTQDDLPVAPNFFLEVKGPDGSLAVAMRQACYNGALGARSMQSLQSYPQDIPTYDNNAYTLTSIYHGGQLKLYATHPGKSNDPDRHSEYFMNQLRSYSLTDTSETFRAANLRPSEACLSDPLSQHQLVFALMPVLDDSDGSTDSGEYQDAQWSFTVPVEGGEEDPGKSGRPRRPRIRASESLATTSDAASHTTSDKSPRLQN